MAIYNNEEDPNVTAWENHIREREVEFEDSEKVMSRKLEQDGVILSTDELGNDKIQRIDDAKQWMIDNGVEYVKQLNGDEDAVEFVRELIIDNYTETIHQDLMQGDKSLLWGLLSGNGLKPIHELTEQELIIEAKELGIF